MTFWVQEKNNGELEAVKARLSPTGHIATRGRICHLIGTIHELPSQMTCKALGTLLGAIDNNFPCVLSNRLDTPSRMMG